MFWPKTSAFLTPCSVFVYLVLSFAAESTYAGEPEAEYKQQISDLRKVYAEKLKALEEAFNAEADKLRDVVLAKLREERHKYRHSNEPGSFELAKEFDQRWEEFETQSIPKMTRTPLSRFRLQQRIDELTSELDDCLGINRQRLANPDCETVGKNNQVSDWETEAGSWIARQVPWAFGGKRHFFAENSAYAALSQKVSLSAASKFVDNEELEFSASVYLFCHNQNPPDSGEFVVEFLDSEGKNLGKFSSGKVSSKGAWKKLELAAPLVSGTRYILVRLIAYRTGPRGSKQNDAQFDNVSLVISRQ